MITIQQVGDIRRDGIAGCVVRFANGTERLVYCEHRGHITYSHVPAHRGRAFGAASWLQQGKEQAS